LKDPILLGCGLVMVVFPFLTWHRISVWKDGIILFTDVIKKYPENPDRYFTLGDFKMALSDFQEALDDYNKCL